MAGSVQCYLKDAAARIEADMQRAAAEGWKFGAKTVRGAYMVVERGRAAERGYESPIWDSLAETHANYNRSGATALRSAQPFAWQSSHLSYGCRARTVDV